MLSFKRSYMVSAVILSVVAVLSTISGIEFGFDGYGFAGGSLSVALVALLPIVWRGGIVANLRLAISIAFIFGIVSRGVVALSFFDFVLTTFRDVRLWNCLRSHLAKNEAEA